MPALFAVLPESGPAVRRRSPAGVVTSIALHAAVATFAIVATATADSQRPPKPETARDLIWLSPGPLETTAGSGSGGGETVARRAKADVAVPAGPPMPRVDLTLISDLPTTIGGTIGERWPGAERATGRGAGDPGAGAGNVFTGPQVETAAALRGTASPRYPDVLRAQGVEGRVTLRFVVDTTGRVEPASVRVVASTNDLFAAAARATAPTLRFTPASVAGRHVRQLVELPFTFELRR